VLLAVEQCAPKMSDTPKLVVRLKHGGFAAGAMLEMTNLRPIGALWLLPFWEKRCDEGDGLI
jgi:hypothetical protein